MNYFVEGLQGSGKSTLVGKLSDKYKDHEAVREGDYSPVELAWCAYVSMDQYDSILEKYSEIKPLIEAKSVSEDEHMIICYTQIITDVPGFHRDLEQYEIYNGRSDFDEFKDIVLGRYRRWNTDKMIFECSLFQNTVEDMILYRCLSDEEIIDFYREVCNALEGKDMHIYYLKTENISESIDIIRKERSDDDGNEMWYPLMIRYFDESPYAKKYGVSGNEGLLAHLEHRQQLELRMCQELFGDKCTILKSKEYDI
ncbi:hypothetical protein [Butyrivibrio fibrisolvens]|uniref:hypothetical protein n=1 Tax=Butyrivibrio fibrisolvens TaxID=831 RepID=UPI000427641D|nr:hypothetical protein [Butyrivibrio fibrisolvens]